MIISMEDWIIMEETLASPTLKEICYNGRKMQERLDLIYNICNWNMRPPAEYFLDVHSRIDIILRDLISLGRRMLENKKDINELVKGIKEIERNLTDTWEKIKASREIKDIAMNLKSYYTFLTGFVFGLIKELETNKISYEDSIAGEIVLRRVGIEPPAQKKRKSDEDVEEEEI
jgi:hypothetical protein